MADMKDKAKGAIDTAADKAKQGTDRAFDAAQGAQNAMHGAGGHGATGGAGGNFGGGSTGGNFGGSAGGGAGAAGTQAKDAVGQARDAANELYGQAKDKAAEYAAQARDKVNEWVGDPAAAARQVGNRIQSFAGDLGEMTPERMKDFGNELAGMIARYPIPAVLIGFGLGLMLGRGSKA